MKFTLRQEKYIKNKISLNLDIIHIPWNQMVRRYLWFPGHRWHPEKDNLCQEWCFLNLIDRSKLSKKMSLNFKSGSYFRYFLSSVLRRQEDHGDQWNLCVPSDPSLLGLQELPSLPVALEGPTKTEELLHYNMNFDIKTWKKKVMVTKKRNTKFSSSYLPLCPVLQQLPVDQQSLWNPKFGRRKDR